MDAMTWSEISHKQAPLPKLRIAQETPRRDSLSSSRTGDSGYNSDPEISLSPLEFAGPDQIPYTSATFTFDSSALFDVKDAAASKTKRLHGNACNSFLFKRHKTLLKTPPDLATDVTSNPIAPAKISDKPVNWTKAFKKPVPRVVATPIQEVDLARHDNVEQWIEGNLQPQDRPQERKSSIISLSSTGSCDMYSNTDDNSEDEDGLDTGSTLSKATLKTIQLVMRRIEVNLGYVAFIQCAGGQGSKSQGGTSNTTRGGRNGAQGSGGKRKSRFEDHLPPDDPDEEGSSKRRRVSIATTTEDSESGPRFACPFYKHDPNRYRNRRTCPGPGWPTVHRMKEHLYRSHAQPIFCPRCYATFDSTTEFSAHLRAHPCQISMPQPIEGIDRETLNSLRKRSPALRLEEDKWRDAYQLLFPDVATTDIPSPYYDSDSPSEESRRFRRELLDRVRQELFATAEQEPGPVEQRLLRQVAGIIQRCESELMSSSYPALETLHASDRASRRTSTAAIPSPSTLGPANIPAGPAFTPRNTSSFPSTAPMSPRTVPVFHPTQQPPSGLIPEGATSMSYPDPFPSDWIDWNIVFPPGPELHVSGDHGDSLPALTTPVWT